MFDALSKHTLAPLLLRLGLAAIFIYHGMALVSRGGGTTWSDKMPVIAQALVAWGELLGGLAMALGVQTRLAALGLMIIMVGAIATVHWPNGFDNQDQGFEFNYLIIMVCAALVLTGGGTLAVDRFFRLRRKT